MLTIGSFAAIMALFGARFPEAPQYPNIVEGPFDWRVSFASADSDAKNFIAGTDALLSWDDKLYVSGIDGSTGQANKTGVLYCDSIGLDLPPVANTGQQYVDLLNGWNITHSPQGNKKDQSMGLSYFTRIPTQVSTTVSNVSYIGSGQFVPALVPFAGGSWKVNIQSDGLTLQRKQKLGSGTVTLTSTMVGVGRLHGVFLVGSAAQQLNVLDTSSACDADTAKIGALLDARRALGQPAGYYRA